MKRKLYVMFVLISSVLFISACSSKIDNDTKENPNPKIEKTQNNDHIVVEDKNRKTTTYTGTLRSKDTYIEILGVQSADGYVSYQSGMLMVEDIAGNIFTLPVDKTFSIYDENISRQGISKVSRTKNIACKDKKDESGIYLVSPHCFAEDNKYIYARTDKTTADNVVYTIKRIKK